MSSTLKNERHTSQHFKVSDEAKNLRTEISRYILHDFDSEGPLAYMGQDWLDDERNEILDDLRNIYGYIQEGNAVHMVTVEDYRTRRNFINLSIASAKRLSAEFDWLTECFAKKINVDKYTRASDSMVSEIKLLKGWRRQTDKIYESGKLI